MLRKHTTLILCIFIAFIQTASSQIKFDNILYGVSYYSVASTDTYTYTDVTELTIDKRVKKNEKLTIAAWSLQIVEEN